LLSIIDRFLLRETFKALLVIVFILMVVLFASQMVSLLGKIAAGSIRSDILFSLITLQMIVVLAKLLPAAYFFALLWVLAGMYRDNEMVALFSTGVSIQRIYRSALISALPVTLATAVLSMALGPWAGSSMQQIKDQPQSLDQINIIEPAKFNALQNGRIVIYAKSLSADQQYLNDIFLQDKQRDKPSIVLAEKAHLSVASNTGEKFMVLTQGKRYQGLPGQADYAISEFAEYGLRIQPPEPLLIDLRMSARPIQALLNDDALPARAEVQYRLSLPLAVLAFAMLAVPLARSKPRQDIYGRVAMAILIYFIFMNLQRIAERWMETGATPAWIGMWWVPLFMLGVAGCIILLDSAWWAAQMRRFTRRPT
jgi:lipopolysaccharide export system permease protein